MIAIAVTSVAKVNCLACSKAFCPVEPSNTSNTSSGAFGHYFLHYIFNFGQLVHQADFIVQASGRINNHDVRIVGNSRAKGVKATDAGSAPIFCLTTGTPTAFSPNHQLFYSSCTECISGSQINRFAGFLELISQFADSCSFPTPFTPLPSSHKAFFQ